MKYLYQCEKCGRTFDTYDEASACEEKHVYPWVGYHEYGPEMRKLAVWDEGDVLPRKLVVASEIPNGHENDELPPCEFGVYNFERHLDPYELYKIKALRLERMEKEKKWLKSYENNSESEKTE